MTKVVRLIRHAESAVSAGLVTTAPDTMPLTDHGRSQAIALAETISVVPDLIVSSPFERAKATALPTANRFGHVPVEIWAVEEFTYPSPGRFAGTTQADRKPMADAYWHLGDMESIDGPGAECFSDLLVRAETMLDRLATSEANTVLVFSHGQFIRAVAWFIRHSEAAGTPENMRLFRELDTKDPLPNCAGYDLELREGRWEVVHQIAQDGEVKFIDEFCTDQGMAPIPLTVMTRGRSDSLEAIRTSADDNK
ncbi:histidine phosphatase family protein [Pseudomonas lutea]|uniref:Histidine phosphatase family protein n=1 Tax=Pseudomonas lutea TaxID=243924 RepID=A0ABR9ACB2_9PSED|nr:histidine phosphatase family protein [Pseudomonas lutea]MBD8123676.1 histidine phosphatase family protein [Pseudomonas lutea]